MNFIQRSSPHRQFMIIPVEIFNRKTATLITRGSDSFNTRMTGIIYRLIFLLLIILTFINLSQQISFIPDL